MDLLNSLLLSPIKRTQSAAHWGGASCASLRNLLQSRSAGLDSAAPNPHDPCTSEHTCASERTDSVPPRLPPSQFPPLLPSIRACTGSRRERHRGSASPTPSISSLESPAAPRRDGVERLEHPREGFVDMWEMHLVHLLVFQPFPRGYGRRL